MGKSDDRTYDEVNADYKDVCENWRYASPSQSVTVDITESPQAQPMSLVTNHKQNENPANNPLPMTPLNLSRQQTSIDQKLNKLNREFDLKTDKENRKRNLDQSVESTSSSTSSRKTSQEVFFNGFTLQKYISTQQKEAKKDILQEHHGEQKAINLILIWTAFFQGTIDVEQNQRISKNKTQYSMLSKMYRMRKTSKHVLNHLMTKSQN